MYIILCYIENVLIKSNKHLIAVVFNRNKFEINVISLHVKILYFLFKKRNYRIKVNKFCSIQKLYVIVFNLVSYQKVILAIITNVHH